MTIQTMILAAAALLAAGTANAEGLKPARAQSVDLGTLAGVAYYTPESEGYRVVVTLAPRAAAPAVRFETVLAEGQRVTLSAPRGLGQAADAVEIARKGEAVTVVPARARAAVREAAALN
ncbi:hypothetical protein [Methylobacterium segetis]|uniref:hypothetical protein n=2 Tax=Methylobacterium segetis TaxID=2488750 RepID=UPI00104EE70F|nr:hypothetical protein [Methylobacterium segetis]